MFALCHGLLIKVNSLGLAVQHQGSFFFTTNNAIFLSIIETIFKCHIPVFLLFLLFMMQSCFIEQSACMQRSKTKQKTGTGMCQDQVMQEVEDDVCVEVVLEDEAFPHHPRCTFVC